MNLLHHRFANFIERKPTMHQLHVELNNQTGLAWKNSLGPISAASVLRPIIEELIKQAATNPHFLGLVATGHGVRISLI